MIETIGAFGSSIWRWFVENKDVITAFFMSGQFLSFVAALVMLVKSLKRTKTNTDSTNVLNATLTNTNTMSNSIQTLDKNFELLKNENSSLRSELSETETRLQEANKEIRDKLNSIIEVQAIVYSTIRDDSVRQTVNTILNNARYCEKNFKESLETQIEELRKDYNEQLKEVNEKMNKSIDEITSNIKTTETAQSKMMKNDTYRY